MNHIRSKGIILYPEFFLVTLTLPWQFWFLMLALYPCIPKTEHLYVKNCIHYVNKHGEIIAFCKMKHTMQTPYFTFITERFGKSIIILHRKHRQEPLSIWFK